MAFVASLNRPAAGGGGGGGCTTEAQAEGDEANFDDTIDWTAVTWNAMSFVAGSSFTACKAQAFLYRQGTAAAGTLQVLIYDNNAGVPGSIVGTASATVDRTSLAAAQVWVDFTGLSASLTSGQTYWFILKASALDTDASNRIFAQKDNAGETGNWYRSNDGVDWGTAAGANTTFLFKLFQ